jgi:hypothetical protein
MRMIRSLRALPPLLALAAVAAGSAAPARAQSLLAARGLGYVAQPVEGRARALGGVALGLPGYNLSLVNPAGVAGIPAPTLTVAFQPDFYSSRLPQQETEGSTARFPLIQAVFPFRERWTASVGYGAFLDQNWAVRQRDTLRFAGRTLAVTDSLISQGGVGRFRAGAAYRSGERLAVGAALDLYTGSSRLSLNRVFEPDALREEQQIPATFDRESTYSGVGGALGVHWAPVEALHLAAAVSAGGTLSAEPEGDSTAVGPERSYSLPLMLHVGASGRVAPGALVALSTEWSGWSSLDGELVRSGGARDTWALSGGVEWDSPDREGETTSFPLRVGARYAQLPFRWGGGSEGNGFPSEKALTAGAGARLAGGAALADLGVERGWRGGGDTVLDESYWRLTLSLTLLGR